MKIFSLPKHENLTTSKKYCGKEEKLLGAISPLFHIFFDISLTPRVQLNIHLLNMVVRIIFFLKSENLICRGTDISKCFRESLGIRDNESRLYLYRRVFVMTVDSLGSKALSGGRRRLISLTRRQICVSAVRMYCHAGTAAPRINLNLCTFIIIRTS